MFDLFELDIVPMCFEFSLLFLGTQALPRNRGAYVDDQKWQQADQAGTAGLTVSYRRSDRLCSVADPAIRHTGGQTACDSRFNRLYESAQNVNLISPLRRYRRGGQDAYVDRLIRSPDEEVMAMTRISAAQRHIY